MKNALAPVLILTTLLLCYLCGCVGSPDFVLISGAGSTFLAPQLERWIGSFEGEHPNVEISYSPVGSGAGQSLLFFHVISFAGSDPPLSHEKWEKYEGKIIQMPIVLGGVAIIYNLPGIKGHLKLNGKVLAEIYLGKISNWNSEEIEKLNPGIKLPNYPIIVVHRSDASGTTQIFTTFLYKSSGIWPKDLVGKSISWPVDKTGRGIASQGNEGVTSTVLRVRGAIGYVSYSYALLYHAQYAAVQNPLGEFVLPSPKNITLAATGIRLPNSPLGDFSYLLSEVVYSKNKGSYPISSFSFLILFKDLKKEEELKAMMSFIYFLNTKGQQELMPGYAKIPERVSELNLKAISLLGVGE